MPPNHHIPITYMDHCYNIVWADDEIDALLIDKKTQFERKGMSLIPCRTASEAIDEIERNASFVDGIIVDAKFSMDGEAVEESGRSVPGLTLFMHKLDGLREKLGRPLPCWIFTGYGDLLYDRYDENDLAPFERIVDKNANYALIEDWLEEICDRIKETTSDEFHLRQTHAGLFALCSEGYLGMNRATDLLEVLSYEKDVHGQTDPAVQIRNLVDSILDLLVKRGVIPFTVGSQSRISLLPRALKLRDIARDKDIPSYIVDSVVLLCNVSELVHPDTPAKLAVESDKAPYLYPLLISALKTVMHWLKPYLDSLPACPDESLENGRGSSLLPGYRKGKVFPSSWYVLLEDRTSTAPLRRDLTENSFKKGAEVQVRLSEDRSRDGKPFVEDIKPLG